MAESELAANTELTSITAPLELARPTRRGLRAMHPAVLIVVAILVALPAIAADVFPFGVSLATSILVFSIFTMSLDLLLGYSGLPSFGHAAFLGLGAYAAAILSAQLGISNLGVALIAAITLASVGSIVLGLLALRTSGVYFLMLTLAFAQMLSAVALKWGPVTGGTNGLPGVHSPELFVPGLTVGRGIPYYVLTLVAAIICFILMYRLIHSPFGRTLIGIHQNEARMRAIGYNTRLYKLGAFWVAGVFASVAGVLYAFFNQFISPDDIGFTTSGTAVLMVLLGGEATLIGPILGTTAYLILQNVLSSLFARRWQLILGALFVVFVLFVRGGIVGIWIRMRRGKLVALVSLEGVCKNFAGVQALRDVSLAVEPGERRAIIGPNGAGKTTLFNIISGDLPPSSGVVSLNDQVVTNLSPERMFRLGLARTFQKNSLFLDLTTFENVRLAVQAHQRQGHHWFRPWWSFDAVNDRTRNVLERAGLWARRDEPAKNLSYGEQRQLEMAIALAGEPRLLLLLDEPTAGMSVAETASAVATIGALSRDLTVLIIEHDMDTVFALADRITVLDHGQVIADGAPDDVRHDAQVRAVYLGEAD